MMDKCIGCAHDPKSVSLDPVRVVIVFKQTDPELLVEPTHLLENVSPHRQAEHRQHWNLKDLSIMLSDEACGPGGHVLRIAVADVNFRFVTDSISHRTNQPHTGVSLKMANQSREPTAGNDGVIVQKHQIIASRLP